MARDSMDDRLDEEVKFHIEMQTERNIRMGMTPEDARRQANREFGGREKYKEEARDEYQSKPLADLRKDVVFALRSLRSHRAFALTAILTLALGIGASTAIFSVVNAVLLRPLPYADAGRLVLVWGDMRARKVTDFPFSPPNMKDLKDSTTQIFKDLAAISPGNAPFTVPGQEPEQVKASFVTWNFFNVMGARMVAGRDFTADDGVPPPPQPQQQPGQAAPTTPPPPPPPNMIVLSHSFWKRRFGGDPSVVGKSYDLGGQTGIVVGVLEPDFEVLFPPNTNMEPRPDIYGAVRLDYERASRLNVFLRIVGRLKPGVTLDQANRAVEGVATGLREKYAIMKSADTHWRVEAMHEDMVADVRPAIFALMGAVTFVLLIACANVANLLLVRAAARERELAIRAALGSSPWRIIRQLLAESVVLALGGALIGLGLAWAGIKLLVSLSPSNLPRLDSVSIDPIVLGFATLAALVAAAIFGIIPAIRASRPDLADVLRASGRTPGLGGGKLLRNGVVTAEVALSFVLLVGGGLMVRSFIQLANTSPGFDPKGVLTVDIPFNAGRTPDERSGKTRDLTQRLAAIPGVKSVTAAFPIPLDGRLANVRWGREEAAADPAKFQQANLHIVVPGYFDVMGTRLIAGRVYTEADNRPDFNGVVIDETLAKKAFPGQNPVGQKLFIRSRGQEAEWQEIIGVVQHERHEGLATEGREAIFYADGWFGHGAVGSWIIRVNCAAGQSCDPARITPQVRQVVKDFDPKAPVANVKTLASIVDRAMTPTRFALVLIGIFAAVAAVLASVGLYGVLATAVRQRTAEIGVRMAFGATHRSIFALVVGDGMKLSLIGLAVGLVAALWMTRAMTSMLVGVQPSDPLTYGAIIVLFMVIALLACWIPARRASHLDPTNALRGD